MDNISYSNIYYFIQSHLHSLFYYYIQLDSSRQNENERSAELHQEVQEATEKIEVI